MFHYLPTRTQFLCLFSHLVYLSTVIQAIGLDGIYLDGYLRDTLFSEVFNQTYYGKNIDVNGDGKVRLLPLHFHFAL